MTVLFEIDRVLKRNFDLSKIHFIKVSHSVRGCIRNLKLNQMEISLNDVKVIQDIKTGKCHKDVEPGIYFGGDAWGIYGEICLFIPE